MNSSGLQMKTLESKIADKLRELHTQEETQANTVNGLICYKEFTSYLSGFDSRFVSC